MSSSYSTVVALQYANIALATKYCKENCSEDVYKKVLADRNKLFRIAFSITLFCILPIPICVPIFIFNMNSNVVLSLVALAIAFIAPLSSILIFAFNARKKALGEKNQWANFKWYFDKVDKSEPFNMNIDYRSLYK